MSLDTVIVLYEILGQSKPNFWIKFTFIKSMILVQWVVAIAKSLLSLLLSFTVVVVIVEVLVVEEVEEVVDVV